MNALSLAAMIGMYVGDGGGRFALCVAAMVPIGAFLFGLDGHVPDTADKYPIVGIYALVLAVNCLLAMIFSNVKEVRPTTTNTTEEEEESTTRPSPLEGAKLTDWLPQRHVRTITRRHRRRELARRIVASCARRRRKCCASSRPTRALLPCRLHLILLTVFLSSHLLINLWAIAQWARLFEDPDLVPLAARAIRMQPEVMAAYLGRQVVASNVTSVIEPQWRALTVNDLADKWLCEERCLPVSKAEYERVRVEEGLR